MIRVFAHLQAGSEFSLRVVVIQHRAVILMDAKHRHGDHDHIVLQALGGVHGDDLH